MTQAHIAPLTVRDQQPWTNMKWPPSHHAPQQAPHNRGFPDQTMTRNDPQFQWRDQNMNKQAPHRDGHIPCREEPSTLGSSMLAHFHPPPRPFQSTF